MYVWKVAETTEHQHSIYNFIHFHSNQRDHLKQGFEINLGFLRGMMANNNLK